MTRVRQKYVDRCDRVLLGEAAVYPGHYTTLAYLIAQNFECFADAKKPTEHNLSEALGSIAIPGSGTNVSHTMDFLYYMSEGLLTCEDFFGEADASWRRETLSEESRALGLAQAKNVESWLRDNLAAWLSKKPG